MKTPHGFYQLQEKCITKIEYLINEAMNTERNRIMVEIFDDLSDNICKVADLAEFIRIAHPEREYSYVAEKICAQLSGIVEQLNTNRKLYDTLKYAIKTKDIKPLDDVDKIVGELFLFDFEQCGIHLSDEERNKVVELNDFILNVGQQFVNGTSNPRIVKKNMLPKNIADVFMSNGDEIVISSLNTDTTNAVAREVAYKLFLHPDKQQELLLTNLLEARYELAKVCGFNTYAERALMGGIIDKPNDVQEFLDIISEDIKLKAKNDFDCMNILKQHENPNNDQLAQWDVPYFTQKAKKQWFRVSSKEYSPYFSLGTCMEGLNMIFKSLYGIELVCDDVTYGECWNNDVYKLSVISDEGLLGYIYCDFYERTGKPNQDCHFTIKGGKILNDGSYQNPIVVLMLNLPAPRFGSPALLTPNMVDNLFHEMGHAMHSMLARTRYQHITGTRCSTDFAEVPSILMEYFSSDIRVLKRFARHFLTEEPMNDDMLMRLRASKHLFSASETQLQVFYAALDQIYHNEHPLNGDTTQVLAETQNKYYGLPYVANTAFQLRFSHLVGYGAKYYSYLISRAVAQLIWETYFEENPFNRDAGEKYRKECLAFGGGKNPKNLVKDFLNCQPTPKVLAKSILKEIERNQDEVDCVIKNLI